MHLPRALGRGEGLKRPLGPLPGLGGLVGAERHYGRHSLGLVLFIVSTGLNVSGQLYLHVAEKGHHLQLLQRKQTERVRPAGRAGPGGLWDQREPTLVVGPSLFPTNSVFPAPEPRQAK